MRSSCNSHSTVNYKLSIRLKSKLHRIFERKVNSLTVNANIKGIYNIFDDLAKSKSYDCKIVTLKSQNRNTNEKTKQGRHRDTYYKSQNKSWHCRNPLFRNLGKECAGKSSYTHKSAMSDTKFSKYSYTKVKRYCNNRIICHRNQKAFHVARKISCGCQSLEHNISNDHNSICYKIISRLLSQFHIF